MPRTNRRSFVYIQIVVCFPHATIRKFKMSKVATKVKVPKKRLIQKVDHGNKMRTNIPAGLASPGPPLGPMLGLYNVNIASFVKDFNEKTKHLKEGIPLPTRVIVNPDRSYLIKFHNPPTTYFLKQAAGIQKASLRGGEEIAGKITLKHVYEIAKIKSVDPPMQLYDMPHICNMVIATARSCGIQIVKDLDPKEYEQFLEERKVYVEEFRKELDAIKEAKMLRTA